MKRTLPSHRVTPAHLYIPSDETSFLGPVPGGSTSQPLSPSHASSTFCSIQASAFFDLVVIGAGPAALALVARILESRPAALYTDQEHLYLHWLQRKRNPALLNTRKRGSGSDRVVTSSSQNQDKDAASCHCEGQMRILVIDKLGGGWMENWHRQFSAFEIKHLRSPLFFHPAPADLDALLAFADREGRTSSGPPPLLHDPVNRTNPQPELIEIPGCVGAEISKHKRTSR
ncbi:hypothetical protein BDV93DRAFT_453655, partial [Ceratobasidium sp. AG-I]